MDNVYLQKLATLTRAIYEKTQAGEIAWNLYGSSKDKVRATIGDQFITVFEDEYQQDGEGASDIVVIVARGGVEIERFSDTDLRSLPLQRVGYSGWYSFMRELFKTARRQATGADAIIEKLISELSTPDEDADSIA